MAKNVVNRMALVFSGYISTACVTQDDFFYETTPNDVLYLATIVGYIGATTWTVRLLLYLLARQVEQ